MNEILRVDQLKGYYWPRFGKEVRAVNNVSFSVKKGEILGIAGESGCGKSTLARCIMGMFNKPLTYVDGSVFINDLNIFDLPEEKRRRDVLGHKIAYIPQSAMNALNPTIRIKNFIWDLLSSHITDITREEMLKRASGRVENLGLPQRVLNNYACELSGGMKQRVIVMISSLLNPDVLIADEPTSALDVSTQKVLVRMLKNLIKQGIVKSMIFVTHDLTTLRHACDRIAIMYAGELVEVGTVDQIIFNPLHPYTEALISSILVPESEIREKELIVIPGAPPDLKNPPRGCRFYPRCNYRKAGCKEEHLDLLPYQDRLVRCKLLKEGSKVANE